MLGAKTRELIALAVAVTLRCDGGITVHTESAIKNGATREEIVEALGVAADGQCRSSARVLRAREARAGGNYCAACARKKCPWWPDVR